MAKNKKNLDQHYKISDQLGPTRFFIKNYSAYKRLIEVIERSRDEDWR